MLAARTVPLVAFLLVGSVAMQPVGMLIWRPIAATVGVSSALWVAFAIHLASILVLLAVREVRDAAGLP